jgi:hypothetical protein
MKKYQYDISIEAKTEAEADAKMTALNNTGIKAQSEGINQAGSYHYE